MSRISLAIGRARFLLADGAVAAILVGIITVVLVLWTRSARSRPGESP